METFSPEQFLVLIVDHISQNLQVLETMLEQANYRTISAINAQQALAQFKNQQPDLILLNNKLPEIDGLSVYEALKANSVSQDIPIIFLINSRELEHIFHVFQLGAVDYIAEPFNINELLARVKTHLELKFIKEQLRKNLSELEQLAIIDPLTGILNRRYLFNVAEREMRRSRRYNHSFSLLIMDIDYFKQINETYGYGAGDEVLKVVAATAQNSLRREDCFARFGGEEFVALLPCTDRQAAITVAQRIRQTIADLSLIVQEKSLKVTVSIGITTYQADDQSIDTILKRADDALREAKTQGRNRCIINASDAENWWAC